MLTTTNSICMYVCVLVETKQHEKKYELKALMMMMENKLFKTSNHFVSLFDYLFLIIFVLEREYIFFSWLLLNNFFCLVKPSFFLG